MWKPAERIKYRSQPGCWPSHTEAAAARLFAPLYYQRLKLQQRTWVPAMVPWRATEQGEVTADNVDWYGRFARGKPGAIVIEATGIRDVPSGPLLRIGHDRYIPGIARIAERMQAESGGVSQRFIQLIDFLAVRRRPDPSVFFARHLRINHAHRERLGLPSTSSEEQVRAALSQVDTQQWQVLLSPTELESLLYGYRERITDVEHDHIAELPSQLPSLFAAAAKRAEHAGLDGIELHFAHAYTMASFLSATNTRKDGYGQTLEGRLRLPLEVIAAVRANVSASFVVGARMLSDECIVGGTPELEATQIAVQLAAAGLDYLSLSRGGKFDDAKQPKVGWAVYPYTGRSGYECMPSYISDAQGPFGRNVAAVARIRDCLRNAGYQTPVVLAGGIHNFEQAESALTTNQADIVGFARQALADPDWPEKVRLGLGDQVRLCTYSNYCEGLDQKHKQVTCNLWDRAKDDSGCPRSKDGKRRLLAPSWSPGNADQPGAPKDAEPSDP